jgi:hypothetical protein
VAVEELQAGKGQADSALEGARKAKEDKQREVRPPPAGPRRARLPRPDPCALPDSGLPRHIGDTARLSAAAPLPLQRVACPGSFDLSRTSKLEWTKHDNQVLETVT